MKQVGLKNRRKYVKTAISLLIATAPVAMLMYSCSESDGSNDSGRSAKDPNATTQNPPTDTSSLNEDQIVSAASVNVDQSTQAYGQCNGILRENMRDHSFSNLSSNAKQVFRSEACKLDAGKLSSEYRKYKNKKTSSASSDETSIGITYGLIDFDLGLSGTDSSSANLSEEEASKVIDQWRKQACSKVDNFSSQTESHVLISEKVSEVAVQAWRDCITKKQHGFICSSNNTVGNAVSVNLQWSPDGVLQQVLPKLQISVEKNYNAKHSGGSDQSEIGAGSGVSHTFEPIDLSKGMILNINATDAKKRVNFSCTVSIPAPMVIVTSAELCGSDDVRSMTPTGRFNQKSVTGIDPSCGNEMITIADGGRCGMNIGETYTKLSYKGSPQCGATFFPGREGSDAAHDCAAGETKVGHQENDHRRIGDQFCWSWVDQCKKPDTAKSCAVPTGQFNSCTRTVDDTSSPIMEEKIIGQNPRRCEVSYTVAKDHRLVN